MMTEQNQEEQRPVLRTLTQDEINDRYTSLRFNLSEFRAKARAMKGNPESMHPMAVIEIVSRVADVPMMQLVNRPSKTRINRYVTDATIALSAELFVRTELNATSIGIMINHHRTTVNHHIKTYFNLRYLRGTNSLKDIAEKIDAELEQLTPDNNGTVKESRSDK